MNVLILGVNGFVGSSVARYARASGHKVTGIGRSSASKSDDVASYLSANRRNPDFVRHVLKDSSIDVLVDVIPMVLSDTQPLLDAMDGVVAQYVMISSSDVYENYALLQRTSSGRPRLDAVDEDAPLRTRLFPYRGQMPRSVDDPDRYLDDYDKIPIERAVQKLSTDWTILRLPMVYGPGDAQHRFRWAISPMLEHREKLVLPRSWCNWETTYGFVDNVGAAIARILGEPKAGKRVFNIAEINPVSQLEWARKFARIVGWKGAIEMADEPENAFARRLAGLDLSVPLKISSRRFRETLAFSDPVDEPIALARTVESEASAVRSD